MRAPRAAAPARADTIAPAVAPARADSAAFRAGTPARRDTAAALSPADTTAAPADTAADRVRAALARERRVEAHRRRGPFSEPRWVMLRSLVFPGWGQLYNHAWLKAAGVAAAEVWLGTAVLDDQRELRRLDDQIGAVRASHDIQGEIALVSRYNDRLAGSLRREWLLAGVMIYALLDAYVDAHFHDFQLEFENDPALPGGSGRRGVRASLRWGF